MSWSFIFILLLLCFYFILFYCPLLQLVIAHFVQLSHASLANYAANCASVRRAMLIKFVYCTYAGVVTVAGIFFFFSTALKMPTTTAEKTTISRRLEGTEVCWGVQVGWHWQRVALPLCGLSSSCCSCCCCCIYVINSVVISADVVVVVAIVVCVARCQSIVIKSKQNSPNMCKVTRIAQHIIFLFSTSLSLWLSSTLSLIFLNIHNNFYDPHTHTQTHRCKRSKRKCRRHCHRNGQYSVIVLMRFKW